MLEEHRTEWVWPLTERVFELFLGRQVGTNSSAQRGKSLIIYHGRFYHPPQRARRLFIREPNATENKKKTKRRSGELMLKFSQREKLKLKRTQFGERKGSFLIVFNLFREKLRVRMVPELLV